MAKLNYATEYLQTLEQMFPYVLYFGDLFATPNNGRFRWVNSRVIEVPTISTTGRTDGDRDTIGTRYCRDQGCSGNWKYHEGLQRGAEVPGNECLLYFQTVCRLDH